MHIVMQQIKTHWKLVVLVTFLISLWVYTHPYAVLGNSMKPTFLHGDVLLVEELSSKFIRFSRGEIVVFRDPRHEKHPILIKRVIGLPNETVHIFNESVIIDTPEGKRLVFEDSLIGGFWNGDSQSMRLGPDDYFLMGDNRHVSTDSRQWGTIQPHEMIGRPLMRIWPPSRISGPYDWLR